MPAKHADACRCEPLRLESYYSAADIVVLAEIRTVEPGTERDGSEFTSAEIRVLDTFKGAVRLQHVRTPRSSAACGVPMRSGERYWIFAKQLPGASSAWIDSCTGSRTVDGGFVDLPAEGVAGRLRELAAADAKAGAPAPFTDPNCWSKPRRYHTGKLPLEIAQRISVGRTPTTAERHQPVVSPNGAYSFVAHGPTAADPARRGKVRIDIERDYELELQLRGATALRSTWINEKLILVKVDWNENLAADLVLDVEAEKLIYADASLPGESLFEGNRGECNSY